MAYQTATNPETGERLILIDDAWQKIEKSATNEAGEKAYLVKGSWLTPNAAPAETKYDMAALANEYGMPQPRAPGNKNMQMTQDVTAGVYKGFKNVSDTLIRGGASALDYLGDKAANALGVESQFNTRAAVEEAAKQSNAEYQRQYGSRTLAKSGEILGEMGATALPVGLAAKGITKVAEMVPSLAKYLTPVATSVASGGFNTGLSSGVVNTGVKALGGGAGGAITAGLINPEDTGMGTIIGAAVPTVVAPFVKAGVTGAGRVIDLVSGRAGDIKAARIARTALGDQLIPATLALQQARPGITAIQALQEAGIDAAPFMSLGVFTEQNSIGEAYRRLALAQTQEQKNMLIAMTGGGTQTAAREAQSGSKQALNALTTPMRETELQAANQAGQTISQLGPIAAQREASMVSALQGQGRAATDAAQAGVRAEAGAPGFLTQGTRAAESTVLAGEMGAIKTQRQAERDFLQNQIGSLADHGLSPLNVAPIISSIDDKLANPNLYGQTQLLNVLRGLRDDFAGAVAANGGVADARALYSIRKAGISQKIDDMYGSLDPSAKQKLTADVLASVKAPIDKAITDAGGTGWNRYLQTFETGMHEIGQQKLAALALERFSGNKEGFLKLARGNDPKAVEDIFGPGSFNIFKEMGRKSGQLESIASQLERDIAVKTAADSATQGLARIMGMAESKVTGVPAFFSKTATAVNMAAKILRGQVSEKTFAAFEKGMISGKSAAEMLAELPTSERVEVFRLLKNSSEWNPKVSSVGVQSSIDRTNNLAPENRNNLRP
jgi:hypothetical protein